MEDDSTVVNMPHFRKLEKDWGLGEDDKCRDKKTKNDLTCSWDPPWARIRRER